MYDSTYVKHLFKFIGARSRIRLFKGLGPAKGGVEVVLNGYSILVLQGECVLGNQLPNKANTLNMTELDI